MRKSHSEVHDLTSLYVAGLRMRYLEIYLLVHDICMKLMRITGYSIVLVLEVIRVLPLTVF